MRKLLLAGAMLAALALPSKADTFQADSYTIVGGGTSVHITNTVPAVNINALAGQVSLHNNATNTNLLVWCLDIFDGINLPYNYNVSVYTAGDSRPGVANLDATQIRRIAGLMLLAQGSGLGLSDAAIQLAIWKIEYGATFNALGLSGALTTQMNSAMTQSLDGGLLDCHGCSLVVLSDAPINPSQAFGFATQVAVPLPLAGAGLPGLLAACAMMVGFHRRRRHRLA